MSRPAQLALLAVVAFVAALVGMVVGKTILQRESQGESELHALLHDELRLTPAQKARIAEIERRYAPTRKALEEELRLANLQLAQAIEAEHGNGPRVSAAIDHNHRVMGQLQKETLEHLFAMRAVLTPKQAEQFDRTVVKALTLPER
jgi:Spy/CpxP family protein refolding chaperone